MKGSSPRMRGTPSAVLSDGLSRGIIPAYAGNTGRRPRCAPPGRDHPRVCGEHSRYQTKKTAMAGSSPRMRGTPHVNRQIRRHVGIIPAYAGNTGEHQKRCYFRWDHPRVCGEHWVNVTNLLSWEGSSPRMRGTPDEDADERAERGIIPAYAGNTS